MKQERDEKEQRRIAIFSLRVGGAGASGPLFFQGGTLVFAAIPASLRSAALRLFQSGVARTSANIDVPSPDTSVQPQTNGM